MTRVAACALALVCLFATSRALDLDTVCLVDDLPSLIQDGEMFDTSGILGSITNVNVVGGTCDSVYAMITTSLLPIPIPLPTIAKKLNSCSAYVEVVGLMDTTVDVCAIVPVNPPTVLSARGKLEGAGTLLSHRVPEGVLFAYHGRMGEGVLTVGIYGCDGRLVRSLPLANAGGWAVGLWDGRDGAASAGRYICEVRADGKSLASTLVSR